MVTTTEKTRTCPFCKEEIKLEAIKCKHCHSMVVPERPDHGGVCPFCKENVKPDANKCKHCGSQIGDQSAFRMRDIFGQECFYGCYDDCVALNFDPAQCHDICERSCQISMPPQLMVFYERLASRQRRRTR